MTSLLILPILVPFACAVASLLAWRSRPVQRALSVVGALGLLGWSVCALAGV
jgi:formate hydrogenlyase subunit 3/multisubunit Na+/H+ antiporter MnhD subunit